MLGPEHLHLHIILDGSHLHNTYVLSSSFDHRGRISVLQLFVLRRVRMEERVPPPTLAPVQRRGQELLARHVGQDEIEETSLLTQIFFSCLLAGVFEQRHMFQSGHLHLHRVVVGHSLHDT